MKRTTFDFPLVLERGGEPLRVQLIRALRSAVRDGRLVVGSPLPASRVLARDVGVSRGLVVEAYEQLIGEAYLVARRGAATRVAAVHPAVKRNSQPNTAAPSAATELERPRFDFRPGIPDLSLFPTRAWTRAMRRAWGGGSVDLDYPDPRGVEAARRALATYLNRSRATAADPDTIVFCTGFAQAARLVGEVLHARGVRRLAVEDPGHAEQCADFRATGLDLVPVPVDGAGLIVERLFASDAGAVLVTPAHQYPTGTVLAPARRAALLNWAFRSNRFIIEDDYDAEYRYDREPVGAMQGLAPDRVIYVGSASKMLAPSLRQGWLVLPATLAPAVVQAKISADRGSPALEQLALAAFLDAGDLDRHVRRTRAIYKRRRDALVDALCTHVPDADIRGIAAGLHLYVILPRGVDEAALVAGAASAGIRVYPVAPYYANPVRAPAALLMGYGGILEANIEPGVRRLGDLIRLHSSHRLPPQGRPDGRSSKGAARGITLAPTDPRRTNRRHTGLAEED